MYTFPQRLLGDIKQLQAALNHEPAIRPSFAKAGISTVVRIIFATMLNGLSQSAAIFHYLEARGCQFDRDTIDFLLAAYEGEDPRNHLWQRGNLGGYEPLVEAMPAWG